MTHDFQKIEVPLPMFKLEVRYCDNNKNDIVLFHGKPLVTTEENLTNSSLFRVENENESFICKSQDVFSFSITRVIEKE